MRTLLLLVLGLSMMMACGAPDMEEGSSSPTLSGNLGELTLTEVEMDSVVFEEHEGYQHITMLGKSHNRNLMVGIVIRGQVMQDLSEGRHRLEADGGGFGCYGFTTAMDYDNSITVWEVNITDLPDFGVRQVDFEAKFATRSTNYQDHLEGTFWMDLPG